MLIFYVKESDEEKLCYKVVIFQQIEEKPLSEAVRVGRKSADETRPVKVSLCYCSTYRSSDISKSHKSETVPGS